MHVALIIGVALLAWLLVEFVCATTPEPSRCDCPHCSWYVTGAPTFPEECTGWAGKLSQIGKLWTKAFGEAKAAGVFGDRGMFDEKGKLHKLALLPLMALGGAAIIGYMLLKNGKLGEEPK